MIALNHLLTLAPEFDFRVVGDGRSAVARYANNSNYRNDSLIRKESATPSARRALSWQQLTTDPNSVCERYDHRGDPTNHQVQRDHEVCDLESMRRTMNRC